MTDTFAPEVVLKDTAHKICRPGEPCAVIPVPVHRCPGHCKCDLACAYLRVSSVMKRQDLLSPELQISDIDKFSQFENIRIVKVICDINKSGTTFTNRRVDEIIGDIKQGLYKQVVMMVWDRWGRDEPESQAYLRKVKEAGGRVRAAGEDFDTDTDVGELLVGNLLLIAQFRSRQISKSWRRVGAHRLRNGLPHTGKKYFGYIYSKEKGYSIDPVTGPLLAAAYRDVTSGKSIRSIAAEWNAAGIRTMTGALMSAQGLNRMMDTGFAAGYIRRRTKPRKAKDGGARRRDEYDIWADGQQPKLITRGEWEAYCAKRDEIKARPVRIRNAVHALSGLLYCSLCNSHEEDPRATRLVSSYSGTPQNRKHSWVCPRARDMKTHRFVSINNLRAMTLVREWVEAQVGTPNEGDFAREVERLAAVQAATASATQYEEEIERLIRKRKRVNDRVTDGKMEEEDADEQLAEIRAALTEAEAGLRAAKALGANDGVDRMRAFTTLRDEWDNFTPHDLREALATLVKRILVFPPAEDETRAILVPIETWSNE